MKKILSIFAALLFAGSMMADNFVPVTDASTLADGDQIIITNVVPDRAISTTQNTNNRGVAEVTLSEGVIVPGDDVQIITLVAAGANFMLQVGDDAYLYAASNSSNHLKTSTAATVGDNGKFAITITDGVASVIAQGTNARNDMRYNTSGMFSCYASSTSVEAGLKIFKKDGGVTPPAVATPVISGDAEFTESTTVTITCATEGAVIYYSLNGADPTTNSLPYGDPFTLTETATVKAVAAVGGDLSAVATKTFTKVEPAQPITCAEVYNKVKNDEVALNDVTVTYANGKNVYVKDATGAMLLFLPAAADWKAGDVLSGVAGVVDIYNGLYEVKPSADQVAAVTATPGEAPAAIEFTTAPVAADMNKYVILKNVTVSAATFPSNKNMDATIGEETFVLRNNFNADVAFDTEKKYDIIGAVAVYNTTVQVYFINAKEVRETPADEWAEITFTAATAAGAFNDSVFAAGDFKLSCVDTDGNKIKTTANNASFGSVEDRHDYSFRLQTGGKSSSKNALNLTIPADGQLRIAVRSGSNDATDRTIILTQGETELYNKVVVEADTLEGVTNPRIYKFITVDVKKGAVAVTYPVNALNFYSFAFKAAEVPVVTPKYYLAGSMNSWSANPDYELVANPKDKNEFIGEFTFAANDEFKVIGVVDEVITWYPAGMGNNFVISEAGDYKITFNPAGNVEGWYEGFFNVVKKEIAAPISCFEVYQLEKNDVVELLNDVVVTYANGKNVWVKDASASMLIYLPADATWKAGDVLSGIAGVVDVYNGVHEIKPSADQVAAVTATPGEAPAALEVSQIDAYDVNKYIVMKDVEAEGSFAEGTASNLTINGVTVRNQFKNAYTFEAGKKYDIYGVVSLYQNNPQVYFITAEEKAETAVDNATVATKAQKVILDGQLYIIRDGVMFNANGAAVK